MQQPETPSDYQVRLEVGTCTRTGCTATCTDDSSLCAPHHADAKLRARDGMGKLRRRRKRARLCVHCGGPKPRGDTSCAACRIKRGRLAELRPGGVTGDVNKAERIAAATRTHADGRTRYHGQRRRGQQTGAALNRQDLGMAKQALVAFEAGLNILARDDEAKELPRSERARVTAETANQGERVGRHLDDVLERLGHFKQRHGRRDGE